MQSPIFAANWKMHHGPRAAREFVTQFLRMFPKHKGRTVILSPPAIAVEAVASSLTERPEILVGVQNIWTEPKGAFTGECSAPMAKEAGAIVVIVGHSERRHVFGETIEQTALKCLRAVEAGMTPMLCVGEKIDQREAGTTEKVVVEQLRGGLSKLTGAQVLKTLIAYEPVWVIGTGRTATPADASAVHRVIRATLEEIAGPDAGKIPILYGGSVNEGNAESLLAADDVSGLLVGGASLDPAGWARICSTVV
jgi:triosephosphate isomerase